jgi:hypothetical protein
MADLSKPPAELPPPLPPWRVMAVATGLLALAFLLRWVPADFLALARVMLILGGLVAAGAAIWLQPRNALLILASSGLVYLAMWSLDPYWDSAFILMRVLLAVSLVAVFLVGLPWLMGWLYIVKNHISSQPGDPEEAFAHGRTAGGVAAKVVFSLLILLHFGGIATAILSTAPANAQSSWLANKAWMWYRGYLEFAYLTNAYKFYSPDPGPAYLLWFRVEYADGSARWIKLPNRDEHAPDPLAQQFTRRLSIVSLGATRLENDVPTHAQRQARQAAMIAKGMQGIPIHPYMSVEAQYQVPDETSRRYLKEFARHVAQHYPSEQNPALPITGIKIYRVTHAMLSPPQFADARVTPTDEWTFLPYYQGEFTKEGVLKDPTDPLLYWLIPIYRTPVGQSINMLRSMEYMEEPQFTQDYDVHNFLEVHAKMPTRQEGAAK